jgi:hypothetical protein
MAGVIRANSSIGAEGATARARNVCWIDAYVVHANEVRRTEIAAILAGVRIWLALAGVTVAHVPRNRAEETTLLARHTRWVFACELYAHEAMRTGVAAILADVRVRHAGVIVANFPWMADGATVFTRIRVRQLTDVFPANFDCCTFAAVSAVGRPLCSASAVDADLP